MKLANTICPRKGIDTKNSSHISIPGPKKGETIHRIDLPYTSKEYLSNVGGTVVYNNGDLAIAHGGYLYRVSKEGKIQWVTELVEYNKGDIHYHSTPVLLENEYILVTLGDTILFFDKNGSLKYSLQKEMLDDSGYSPNVSLKGEIIITTQDNELSIIRKGEIFNLGVFGYDLMPPPIYKDGSIGVAGYLGTGFARVDLNGKIIWKSELIDADGLVVLNTNDFAALHCLNKNISVIFDPNGNQVVTIPKTCTFSVSSSREWIAHSEDSIIKFDGEGKVIWEYQDRTLRGYIYRPPWSIQTLVDGEEFIYSISSNGIISLNTTGEAEFKIDSLQEEPVDFSIIDKNMGVILTNSSILYIR